MKKNLFFIIFFGTNIVLIFLHLYKQNYTIQLSYERQKFEKVYDELTHQKEVLDQELAKLKNPVAIKHYATQTLGMQKMNLKNTHRLDAL